MKNTGGCEGVRWDVHKNVCQAYSTLFGQLIVHAG